MKNIFLLLLVNMLLLSCNSNAQQQQQDKLPVHDSLKIDSKILNETRIINIWTPPNYATSTDSLPVLYMPDGGLQEDFPHIANTVAELVNNKTIRPVIVVGIENIQRRKDLSGPTEIEEDKKIAPVIGGAEKFRSFINDELFSEINKRYRTTTEKGIIGESLAGLFIVETFFIAPDMFDFYIAMDPSLWWNNHYLIRTAKDNLAKFPTNQKRLWFAGSKTKDISGFTNELSKILATQQLKNLSWKFSDEPKEKHNTIYRATKEKALIWSLSPSK